MFPVDLYDIDELVEIAEKLVQKSDTSQLRTTEKTKLKQILHHLGEQKKDPNCTQEDKILIEQLLEKLDDRRWALRYGHKTN